MRTFPSLPALVGLLGILVSASARAEFPLVSSSAVAGAASGSQAYRLAQNPATGDVYAAGVLKAGAGNLNIWVARYSPALVLLSTYTHDKAGFDDAAFGVAVDTVSGDVFAAGYVSTASALSAHDIWLARFNSALVLQSSITVNGSASDRDEAAGIRVSSGVLYVVGVSSQPGGKGYWLANYDTNFVLLSSGNYYQNNCEVSDFLPTAGGTFVVGGRAPNFLVSNDAWIGKFDANHVFLASSAYNGPASQTDHLHALAEDGSGGVFAVGFVYSATMADQYIAHFNSSLVRTASTTVNGPNNNNDSLGSIARTASGNLLVGGSYSAVAGLGGINFYLAEYDASLNKLSSTSYASPGSGGDWAASVLIGANQDVYAAGYAANGGSQDIWLGRFSTSAVSVPYPGCATTNDVGSGRTYATIQSAVDALPSTLTGPSCVVIRDGATYAEQVTVRGFTNNGSSITILADPASGLRPVVAPPAASTAAFLIANASVSVQGVDIAPTDSLPYGIFISSAYVQVSSVNVKDGGGKIATAGIAASSWTTISYASVTAGGAAVTGIWLPGSVGTTVSYSTAAAANANAFALRLTGASFNTIIAATLVNLPGTGASLLNSNSNVISRSSIACDNLTGSNAALYLTGSSSNTVTQSYLRNSYADAIKLASGSSYNSVSQSTAVLTGAGGQAAIGFSGSHYNAVTGCMLTAVGGLGINLGSSNWNTISLTTMSITGGTGRQALLFNVASSNTVTQCHVSNPDDSGAEIWNGSAYNLVSQSVIVGGPSANLNPSGVHIVNGLYNTITQSRISNPGAAGVTFNSWADRNTISLSTITGGATGIGVNFTGGGTNTVTGSYIQGAYGAITNGARGTNVDSSMIVATDASGSGVRVMYGQNCTLTGNTIRGGANGAAITLDLDFGGAVVFTSNTVTGAGIGVFAAGPAAGASLSISSMTFMELAPGATAIRLIGLNPYVSTFSAASFDASVAVNVDAGSLSSPSRITMTASTGARAGAAYENDPNSVVDWASTLPSVPAALAASGVGLGAATLSWASGGNPGGTVYQLERSSGAGYGLRQSSTALSFLDLTLSAASTYYYRVRALNAELAASPYSSTIAVVSPPVPVHPAIGSVSPSTAATGTSLPAAVVGAGFDASAALSLERPSGSAVWVATGSFTQARELATLTRLRDGRALLAGGLVEGTTAGRAEADLFSLSSGAWAAAAPMNLGRFQHAATMLADGRVLVTGGQAPNGSVTASAEIFDPASGAWTAAASMAQIRKGHRAALLADGRVLAFGGYDGVVALATAEIYDPALNAWSAAATMGQVRMFPVTAVLSNGKVLAAGGRDPTTTLTSSQLYDPGSNTWSATGAMSVGRSDHWSVVLPDGRVLAAGGLDPAGESSTAEVFDPATSSWTATGAMAFARRDPALVLYAGRPLVIGGETAATDHASTELYDAAANTWSAGPSLTNTRTQTAAAAVLDDGGVLLAGGRRGLGGGTTLNTAERLAGPVTALAATGVSVPDAQHVNGTISLIGAATGYWDVVVRQSGGRVGRLPGGVRVSSAPVPAPTLVSIAVSPSAATVAVSSSVLFTAVGTFSDGSTRALNGSWAPRAAMNEARTDSVGAFSGGKLYLFSGAIPATSGTFSSEAYDPAADSWTYRTASPVRRSSAFAAEYAGKIYVAGGCVDSNCTSPNALLYEYDTGLDAWTAKASMPSARFEASMGEIGGKLYAAGGLVAGYASTNTLAMYDPALNTWTAKAPMPYARGQAASGVIAGKLYVAGGRINSGAVTGDEVQIYDPASNAWSLGAPMPSGRLGAGGAVVNGRLYVIGGDHDPTALSTADASRVQIYDPASNAWTQGPPLLLARWGAVTGAHAGKVYATATAHWNLESTALEVLSPDEAVWSSNAPTIGTVTAAGSATGLLAGTATITASSGAVNASGSLTVVGLPGAPSAFAGSAQSTASILWTWAGSTTELGFRVVSGTASVSGDLPAGTTLWLQTGLTANASASLLVQAYNSSGTVNSGTASVYTLAAAPGTPASSGIFQSSAALSWSAGGNPAGTVYQLERSTGAGYGLQFSGPATYYLDAALAPGETHYFRVRAMNGDSLFTAYSSTFVLAALPLVPAGPGGLAGTALGVSSITWSWTLSAGATNYLLYRPSDGSLLAASASAPYVQTGLTANTAYGLRVAGVNNGGTGALSAPATAYTAAAAPAGGAAASITSTTLTASWGLGVNPASTLATLERSLDAVAFSTVAAGAFTSYADADLLGCTTYYYRVRNANGDGVATAYSSFQALTANTIPSPPSGLAASANAGGTIALSWGFSPTEGVAGYRLYWDAGTGTVSYGAALAVLGSTQTSFTTGVLTSSASYTFALRAVHRCGDVEAVGAVAMSGAASAPAQVRAAIKEPDSGRRVNGNRVTILGELIAGTPSDVQQVVFQYKLATSSAWLDVDEANVNHPNPDFSFPYFVHADVTVLAPGAYDLRAVAYDTAGAPDPAPPAVRVVVDPVTPDISETRMVDGKIKKDQTVSNAVTSVVETAGAGAADPAVRVSIPVGAVTSATATLSVISNPAITTAAPSGQTLVGSAIRIDLSNGQSALNGTAEITLTYPDTVLFPSLLQIFYLNEATGQWSRDFSSTVDTASRTVSGRTPHFSTFAIMLGTAFASDLSNVRAYPVPYKPNGSNPDEGRPFSHGDQNSGIIFSNLAAGSEIRIYTMTGRLVASLDNPSAAGAVRWDARNQDGRDVASGAYFAVVSAAGQKNVVKKLVIIR